MGTFTPPSFSKHPSPHFINEPHFAERKDKNTQCVRKQYEHLQITLKKQSRTKPTEQKIEAKKNFNESSLPFHHIETEQKILNMHTNNPQKFI